MSRLEQEIRESFEGLYDQRDHSKYNIALGFFQSYATGNEADTTGKRFCDLKLHVKDENGDDVSALSVPMMYMGSSQFILDFELVKGDQVLVLFSDQTLEYWKTPTGTAPQTNTNPVKDSFNHALAIPISTTHESNLVSATPVDSTAVGLRAKVGNKIELGNGTVELLDLIDQLLTLLQGSVDAAGSSSTGTNSLINAQLAMLQTSLGQIKV